MGLALAAAFAPGHLDAQGWSVSALGGRARSDLGPIDLTSSTVALSVGYRSGLDWLNGSVGIPAGEGDALWGVVGAGLRLVRGSGLRFGAELSGRGFAQEDQASPAVRDRRGAPGSDARREFSGTGFQGELSPFVALDAGPSQLELHAEVAGYRSTFADTDFDRLTFSPTFRALIPAGPAIALLPEARWVLTEGAVFPEVSMTAAFAVDRGSFAFRAGRWLEDSLPARSSWDVGVTVRLSERVDALVSGGNEGFSPLYGTGERESWSAGLRVRVGGGNPASGALGSDALSSRTHPPGRVVISVGDRELPRGTGTPSIAGDFNAWTATAMRRVEGGWEAELELEAGAYSYSFIAEDGSWFVPDSFPGRVSDGFGGYSAVIVVGGSGPSAGGGGR